MKTIRVVRVIVYEGSPEWMEQELGSSLGEGKRIISRGTITATTLLSDELIPEEALKRLREAKYLEEWAEGDQPK